MERAKVIELIRKCMVLSQSPNENEAALAAAKAQELLLKYKLELVEIGELTNAEEEKYEQRYTKAYKYQDLTWTNWRPSLMSSICDTNFCFLLRHGRNTRASSYLSLIGKKTDIEVAMYLFETLEAALSKMATAAWKERGLTLRDQWQRPLYNATEWKKSYLIGAVRTIRARLWAERRTAEQAGEKTRALVRHEEAALQNAVTTMFPSMKTSRKSSGVSLVAEAYYHGVNDAAKMDIRRGLTGGKPEERLALSGA